jgi:integrase/recombinase XerD
MTPLRQRMLDALQLRGLAARTQEAYIGAVAGLAKHYHRSPDQLSAHEVQDYLIHLIRERKLATSSVNQAGSAFRFFYGTVLGLDGAAFEIPLQRAPQALPELLSRAELARLFAHARHPRARLLLMTAYGSGLRLSELCALRLRDVDTAADRMCIHVRHGKGAKDRFVPLPEDLLAHLRSYWRALRPGARRPAVWVFADPARTPEAPPSGCMVQRWYHAARQSAGIHRQGGIHTLRHCYATHLLEAGVDLCSISQWLGHSHISTTMRYLRLAQPEAPEGARMRPSALLSQLPSLH